MEKVPADIVQQIGESLSDIIDVAAGYTSRQEILVKGTPLSESPWIKPKIESRLAGFDSRFAWIFQMSSLSEKYLY